MLLGAHVGHRGGLAASLGRGLEMGAEAVQLFTQSPRQWRAVEYDADALGEYHDLRSAAGFDGPVFCHATYLINLANPDPLVGDRSRQCLAANLSVVARIGAEGLVLHVGSHLGAGLDSCLQKVGQALVRALDEAPGPVRILVENTAGGGGTIGRSLEELARVLDAAGDDPRLGVCLDTQHLWASGVDFTTAEAAGALVGDLSRVVGLERLGAVHLNDSKVGFGSGRDRHENLGQGHIGGEGLAPLLGHPALQGLPALLEVAGAEGNGPTAADLDAARVIHRRGLSIWADARQGAAT